MPNYVPVSVEEKSETEDSTSPLIEWQDPIQRRRSSNLGIWLSRWPWAVHFLFFAGYLPIMLWTYQLSQLSGLQGNEKIYSDLPLQYDNVTFERAGFHAENMKKTIYEGRPTAANSAQWDRLTSVGIVSIHEEEAARLPGGTARSAVNPNEYVVELEMFHQLHCLKALRNQLWNFEDHVEDKRTDLARQHHFDHCIDYLRQVIMCHGDVTPVTFERKEEGGLFNPHHKTVHQCRNFEKIFDWAADRNTTKMPVDAQQMTS
ncbi:hypothetical protein MMC30_006650 [Trapelia coarctata]|nr:hypothetical protein [Trapelia coarctata]